MFFTESVLGRLQAVSILHEIPQERTQKGERAARASGEAVSRGDAGRLAATQLTLALFFASPPPPRGFLNIRETARSPVLGLA